jgi:hypothetical protein
MWVQGQKQVTKDLDGHVQEYPQLKMNQAGFQTALTALQ